MDVTLVMNKFESYMAPILKKLYLLFIRIIFKKSLKMSNYNFVWAKHKIKITRRRIIAMATTEVLSIREFLLLA